MRHSPGVESRQCHACPTGRVGFCARLSPDCRKSLSTIARRDRVPAGAVIGRQGEPAQTLISITRGVMVMTRLSPSGDSSVVGFRYPGELVMPHQQSFTWPVTIQALCAAQTCRFRFDALPELSGHDREFADRLLEVAAEQMAESYRHVELLAYKEVDQRLAWFLLDFATRTRAGRGPRQKLDLPMTRSQIGNYIGVRTETVCRALARLKARDLIAVNSPRRIEILDKKALARIAKGGKVRQAPALEGVA